MITQPLIVIIICSGVLNLAPKALAQKKIANFNELLADDKINYMLQRACMKEMMKNMENTGVTDDSEPFDPEANPDQPSAFMVDYANMIRNDVILLDNSVETRTRKRGNFKVKKFNQAIPDPPCKCNYTEEEVNLGEHVFPQVIRTRNCGSSQQKACSHPYVCKESLYSITVLKRKDSLEHQPLDVILPPHEFRFRWVAMQLPVSVGCECTQDYQGMLTDTSNPSLREPKWSH